MKKIFLFLAASVLPFFMNAQNVFIIQNLPINTPQNAVIYMAGSLNSWNPADVNYTFHLNAQNKHELKLNLNAGTSIEFKFTLGSWDTCEKGSNGEEISNRKYTAKANDTVYFNIANWASLTNTNNSTAAENVNILCDTFYIPQLDRKRRIWLYLPKEYATATNAYPVIYMHDGQNLFDAATSFSGEWKVDESLNTLAEQNHTQVIVVGIDNGGNERINELTPYTNKQYGGGSGDLYIQFIVETLKPYIDAHYRTLTDRENTAIWGSSLGGLISLYAVLKYDSVFGKAGIFSPSLWYSDSIYTLAAEVNKNLESKIYFLAGGKEGDGTVPQECMNMIDDLKANKFNDNELVLKTVASGEHNEAFWSAQFSDAFLWLFEGISDIKNQTTLSAFKVYPNPVKDTLYIECSEYEDFSVRIYSMDGKLVKKTNGNHSLSIAKGNLPNGIYIVKIKYKGKTESRKIEFTN
jgi:predicted alpha/beta superfamily hydrolase